MTAIGRKPGSQRRRSRRLGFRTAGWIAILWLACAASAAQAEQVTIFAAASTTNAVTDVANAFEQGSEIKVTPVFAASSTLAKQIAHGAPADLFLSASLDWMDYLEARAALESGSRRDLLGNDLVLVVPRDSALSLSIAPGFALAEALGERRLAIGDPAHVPAGLYAKAALVTLGVWQAVEPRIAAAANVRAALALVERRAAVAGIVYATDAAISRRVRVAATFPQDSHPPIVYPLGITAGRDGPAVRAFAAFLHGEEAAAIFRGHGFRVPGPTD